jgi:hypothetical protein
LEEEIQKLNIMKAMHAITNAVDFRPVGRYQGESNATLYVE